MGKTKRRLEMGEDAWVEYQRKRKNNKSLAWKARNADKVVNWRRRVKLKLIEYKGGKCQICGYDKPCPSAYDFHHRDPNSKDFKIGGMIKKLELLLKEADKCDLLCKNCHAETHDKEYSEAREQSIKRYESLLEKRTYQKVKKCASCGKTYEMGGDLFCSLSCYNISRCKVERPERSVLLRQVHEMGYSATGRFYGVSDNCIRKWIRK